MSKETYCEFSSEKLCDDCNDCNKCDIDPVKLCDSCGKCINLEGLDYGKVFIEGLVENQEDLDEYIFEETNFGADMNTDENNELNEEFIYIEDIPELREVYENRINQILSGNIDEDADSCGEDCGCNHHHEH